MATTLSATMTDDGFDPATLDDVATGGFPGDDTGSPNAAIEDAEAAVEAAEEAGAEPDELDRLRAELKKARDTAAGHKGEATQVKRRAAELEQENLRLRQEMEARDARLDRIERDLAKRNTEVAEVETQRQRQRYIQERVGYWAQRGYSDQEAEARAQDDLTVQVRYEEVETQRRRLEEQQIVAQQQAQEAKLEYAITREVREAVADYREDGLTISVPIQDVKDEIAKRFRGKQFNEADVARVVARLAREAAKDASTNATKTQRAAQRASNRREAVESGAHEFEDGGTAGLSFDELEERYAAGDTRLHAAYEAALRKRGLA